MRLLCTEKGACYTFDVHLCAAVSLVPSVVHREADRLAEAELAATQPRKGDGEDHGSGGDGDGSGGGHGSVLCARCNADLAASSANGKDAGAAHEDSSAVSCKHFRTLLPNVTLSDDGSVPYRSAEWVRWTMRAIFLSKLVRGGAVGAL